MPDLPQRLSDWLAGVSRPPIADFIGLRLVSAGSGSSVLEVNVDRRLHNPIGTVHGGIFADLADAAMGTALATLLAEGETSTTADLAIHFLAPVREGQLRARAGVIRRGRRAAYEECDVETEEASLVARAHSTLLLTGPEV